MVSILIKNGMVIDPERDICALGCVYAENGAIMDYNGQRAETVIDAEGCWVVPGLIDLHVHLREPGFEYKETIATGARAAVAGGFTTICAMPNTSPVADSPDVIALVIDKAREAGYCRVLPVGSITVGQNGALLCDFAALKQAGACAFSEDGKSVMDYHIMERAFERAYAVGLPILAHCEDMNQVKGGVMNEGGVSGALGLPGITRAAEEDFIERDIALCKKTGGALHLCHVSTEGGVALTRKARAQGLPVTAEVCPHHFTLSEEDIARTEGRDTNMKMNPPLRTKSDVDALLEGLHDGTISVIATDHAPHSEKDKSGGFLGAANGIIGLETAVPLCVDRLVHTGVLTPIQLIEKMAVNPANILGINSGTLCEGMPADITVIAPQTQTIPTTFASKSANSPFVNWRLKGAVVLTVIDGRIYDNR